MRGHDPKADHSIADARGCGGCPTEESSILASSRDNSIWMVRIIDHIRQHPIGIGWPSYGFVETYTIPERVDDVLSLSVKRLDAYVRLKPSRRGIGADGNNRQKGGSQDP